MPTTGAPKTFPELFAGFGIVDGEDVATLPIREGPIPTRRSILAALPALAAAPALAQNPHAHHSGQFERLNQPGRIDTPAPPSPATMPQGASPATPSQR